MARCAACNTSRFMEFECITCCVRWLAQMTRAEVQTNAPVIEKVTGSEHMDNVRQAWKVRAETCR